MELNTLMEAAILTEAAWRTQTGFDATKKDDLAHSAQLWLSRDRGEVGVSRVTLKVIDGLVDSKLLERPYGRPGYYRITDEGWRALESTRKVLMSLALAIGDTT